jgi:hypothetical protein
VMDGEQLIGARQNRMTNRSILLPAHDKVRIPVSCMEQGRWHFDSEEFVPTPSSSPARVRRQAREVEADRAAEGAPVPQEALADAQGRVWGAIAEHASFLGTVSETGALDHLYDTHAADLDRWAREFPPVEGQVGLLAFLGDRPLGMDVIGGTNLYRRLHSRLLRGYVMDALGSRRRGASPPALEAQRFLDRLQAVRRVPSPTVGRGEYRVLTGEAIGGELLDGPRLVHLSAFPRAGGDPERPREAPIGDPIPSPRQRRRGKQGPQ